MGHILINPEGTISADFWRRAPWAGAMVNNKHIWYAQRFGTGLPFVPFSLLLC